MMIQADEPLYRRVPPQLINDGAVLPAAFQFPRQWVNRGKYSSPDHVVHPDCCDGRVFKGWFVVKFLVAEIPQVIQSGDGRVYFFTVKHQPLTNCFAHSEVWCLLNGAEPVEKPPKAVRETFRILLARASRVVIKLPQ